MQNNYSGGRQDWWNRGTELASIYGICEYLDALVDLFEEVEAWEEGYGGPAWAVGARVLCSREKGKLDAKTFVDRCFSLQHNNGSMFNKASWREDHDTDKAYNVGNAHHNSDITLLLCYASVDVAEYFTQVLLQRPTIWVCRSNSYNKRPPVHEIDTNMWTPDELRNALHLAKTLPCPISGENIYKLAWHPPKKVDRRANLSPQLRVYLGSITKEEQLDRSWCNRNGVKHSYV